jgi:hypothetical protein
MAMEKRCPALLPLVALAYRQPSRLFVCGTDGALVSSHSGARQGNPLGPLFFALTLQDPLEKVTAMQLACPIAYADDNLQQSDPWRQEV